MKKKKIDHIAFVVDDIKKACDFYSKRLDMEILFKYEDWAMLKNDALTLALTMRGNHPYHIAIMCETLDEIEDIGSPNIHRDGSISCYEDDGSGNSIEWIYYPHKESLK